MRILSVLLFLGWIGTTQAAGFTLTSPDVQNGATISKNQVYKGSGCNGDNISPELRWSGEPKGAKSFAVTVYDPDAPTGSGWWHWLIFNIPASVHELARDAGNPKSGSAPAGSMQGRNDFGMVGYGGPCPPPGHGVHHYHFTVYALDIERLDVPADASAAMVGFNLNAHKLGTATLEGLYQR